MNGIVERRTYWVVEENPNDIKLLSGPHDYRFQAAAMRDNRHRQDVKQSRELLEIKASNKAVIDKTQDDPSDDNSDFRGLVHPVIIWMLLVTVFTLIILGGVLL